MYITIACCNTIIIYFLCVISCSFSNSFIVVDRHMLQWDKTMTAYALMPSELVVCIGVLFVQPVFLNHVKDTRYLLICKATDLERFILNVSTSLVVLCLLHDIIWVIPCQINKTAQFQINVIDAYLLSNPLFCRVC